MATLIVEVDDKQAIQSLNKLNKSIDNVAKTADKGFSKAGTSLTAIIDPVGLATSAVSTLTAAFVTLASTAASALIDVTTEAINLNKEAELTRLSLIQIFEGNQGAADAFIDSIGELAIRLGTSRQELTGLAKGILPDVGSISGTTELLENVIVLGRDAGQGIESIRIATEEALSGNLKSLGRRLNIPQKTLDSIEKYQKSMSLADAINKGLAERIAETGISADVTADSFVTLQGKIQGAVENFIRLEGIAPFEELKQQARDFIETLDTQEESIGRAAQAFGDLAANVISFVGGGLNDFIAGIDFEAIEELVDAFNRALAAAEYLIDALFELPDTEGGIKGATAAIRDFESVLLFASNQAIALRAGLQGAFLAAKALYQIKTGDLLGAIGTGQELFDLASSEAIKESTDRVADATERYNERIDALNEAQKERRKVTEDTSEADIAAGDALLKRKKAEEELADAQSKAAEAQDEINKKTAEAEEDRQKRLTGIIRKEAQQRFDDAVKAAQKREDIARENAQAIEDIFRKTSQDLEDAANDLTRDEQDIARKGARDRHDIERQSADERIDIERNFRRELRRIQDQFNQDAQEAERNNDAQAFLQAVRNRDQQVKVATEDRDTSVEDATANAQRQREELAISLAAEVEDAKIANARKLEDLQNRLNQELEEQAIKNQRALEEQAINDQRLAEQRALSLQRELEDFARTEAEKQAKLQESLAAQYAAIEEAGQKELALTAQIEAEKTRIVQTETERRRALLAAQAEARDRAKARVKPEDLRPGRSVLGGEQQFASGGRTPVGKPIVVGEQGPEVFVPDSAGTIIPNSAIFSPPASPMGFGGGNSTSITNSPTFNLAESMFSDPIARRNLTNFILSVMAERV